MFIQPRSCVLFFMLLAPLQATMATDHSAKRNSAETSGEASPSGRSLASVLGTDLAKAVAHETDNAQIVYKGMGMNVPVGMEQVDVATALRRYENDTVGDTLQRVTKEVAGRWRREEMLPAQREHYESLVANASNGNGTWWTVYLYEMQIKRQWVQTEVLADSRIEALDLAEPAGQIITHSGLRYRIASHREQNSIELAAPENISDRIYRVIRF